MKNFMFIIGLILSLTLLVACFNTNEETSTDFTEQESINEQDGPDKNKSIEIEDKNNTAKDIELDVHSLIKADKNSKEDINKVLTSLEKLDPASYNSIEGAYFDEVIGWIRQLETSIKMEYIDDIFSLHNKLDGAASAAYGAVMYDLFEEEPTWYIQKLSALDKKVVKSTSNLLAHYAWYHDLEEVISTTQALYETNELSEIEKKTINEIIEALERQLRGDI
ncbi:hypothetical protein LGQ02_10000 [Bacillus shivajii]|uniref:hypothetical protein n=1 Tax=Bacillus shivajii TaxID=1983719 RepID=UPI001CF932BC|nr:hypothetical protein [Bacillus shivajii]UCZ55025.1 hypothetical protein LGQ02_10000 [Bacillus shivajii]